MQCRYKEKIVYAGDMIFGYVYPVYRKAGARRRKFRETTEVQAKLNEIKSRDNLAWVIHANFGKGDMVLHPTYSEECLPESSEQFEKDVKNYMRRIKRIYARCGVECKYVYVMEYSESGRPHLHMVISGGVGREVLEEAWGLGRCNSDRLQFNEVGVVDLARYISKDRRCGKHRYVCSRNLKKPVEKTDVHQWSRKQIKEVEDSANPHKRFADTYNGYWLAEFPHVEKNGVNGGMYMSFVMYKPDSENIVTYRKRGGRS